MAVVIGVICVLRERVPGRRLLPAEEKTFDFTQNRLHKMKPEVAEDDYSKKKQENDADFFPDHDLGLTWWQSDS